MTECACAYAFATQETIARYMRGGNKVHTCDRIFRFYPGLPHLLQSTIFLHTLHVTYICHWLSLFTVGAGSFIPLLNDATSLSYHFIE